MDVTFTHDPHTKPRIHKAGKKDWRVLVPIGRDNVVGNLKLQTHSTHKSRRGAEKALERLFDE